MSSVKTLTRLLSDVEVKPKKLIPQVIISTDSRRGLREYMEDVVEVAELSESRLALVICDGHGGDKAAKFACKKIVQRLSSLASTDWNVAKVVKDTSDEWDVLCLQKLGAVRYPSTLDERSRLFSGPQAQTYTREGWHAGTTVVAVVLDVIGKRGVLVNLGDSRGVWKEFVKKRSRLRTTTDHNPSEDDLGPLGGVIIHRSDDVPRINGDLAVGRALGDNSAELMGTIVHDAVVKEFTWTNGPLRVVLASDGLWDVLGNSEVMKVRTGGVPRSESDMSMPNAKTMVDAAVRLKSGDNITVGVIDVYYPTAERCINLRVSSS